MWITESYNGLFQVARTKDDNIWLVSDAVERGQELIGRANSICTLAILGRGLTGASNTLDLVDQYTNELLVVVCHLENFVEHLRYELAALAVELA